MKKTFKAVSKSGEIKIRKSDHNYKYALDCFRENDSHSTGIWSLHSTEKSAISKMNTYNKKMNKQGYFFSIVPVEEISDTPKKPYLCALCDGVPCHKDCEDCNKIIQI